MVFSYIDRTMISTNVYKLDLVVLKIPHFKCLDEYMIMPLLIYFSSDGLCWIECADYK